MMVRKYESFLISSLLESVLSTSVEFRKTILDMPSDPLPNILYSIIVDKIDVKTNYNAIDVTKNNDEISFLPDNQYQRVSKEGQDPWAKTKSVSKIGRMIRQILNDNGHTNFNDGDIEKFVNSYKNVWNKRHDIPTRKIEIVKGDKIKYWYNAENYYTDGGILGNSCMRYEKCQKYLKLYTENPNKVAMVILTNEDKLIGRALIWKLDDSDKKVYLDRIYTSKDNDVQFIYDWVLENICNNNKDILQDYRSESSKKIKCNLDNVNFEYYPYMDSFNFLHIKDGDKSGYVSDNFDINNQPDGYMVLELRDTGGGNSNLTHVHSDYLHKFIPKKDSVYVNSKGSYLPLSYTNYCKYNQKYYLKEDTVFSEKMDDWIPEQQSINSDKYGIILKEALKVAISKYVGKLTDPFDISKEIVDNRNVLETDEYLRYDTFSPSHNPVSNVNWSNTFKIRSLTDDNEVSILCYEVYETISVPTQLMLLIGAYEYYDKYYVTKLDSELFDIPIKDTVNYVHYTGIINSHKHMVYTKFMNNLHKIKGKDELVKKRIELTDKIDKHLRSFDKYYSMANFLSVNDIEISELFDECFSILCDIVIKNPKFEKIIILTYSETLGRHGDQISNKTISNTIRLIEPIIYYYMFSGGLYSACSSVAELVKNDPDLYNNIPFTKYCMENGGKYLVDDAMDSAMDKITKKYKIPLNKRELYYFLIDNVKLKYKYSI